MKKTTATTAAIAINKRETYHFACQTTWKNGQVTRDTYKYYGIELNECFTADELQALLKGKMVTRKDKFGGTTTRWVSTDALATAAFAKAR